MKMTLLLLLMILLLLMMLSCSVSSVAASQSTCPCYVSIKVPCPNVTAKEMTFDLFRDQVIISQVKCEKNATVRCERVPPRADVDVQQDGGRHHSPSFLVTARQRGLYRCEGTVVFPPPMRKVASVVKIQVLEGPPCTCSKVVSDPKQSLLWIWIVAVAFLSIYGATVTAIAFINWVKLRNTEAHSDYINTKPRASRERRKKKAVQKPIPRHF